jgi:hypothetical protein
MTSYLAGRVSRIGAVLLCIGTLAGCGGEVEQRIVEDQMSSEFITEQNSGCTLGSLDRNAVPSLARSFPAPDGMVLAGFISNWFPGADPFPCNRFKRAEVQGMFEFAGHWPPTPNRVLLMDLVDFQPVAGSVNVGGRTSCTFKVLKRYYPFRVDNRFHHALNIVTGATELRTRPRPIVVPNDIGHWSAVVTDDLYQTDRSLADVYAPTVFLVVQNDPGFDAHQNSACAGNFRFRVRVLSTEAGASSSSSGASP